MTSRDNKRIEKPPEALILIDAPALTVIVALHRNVDVALALTVHALAGSVFYHTGGSALKAFVSPRNLRSSIRLFSTCPAVQALSDEQERIGDILPGQQADLWD